MRTTMAMFLTDETGATAIEYGLIAAMIAVGCIAAMTVFGGGLQGMFNMLRDRAGDSMDNAGIGEVE